jgi:hypothetical protein
VPRPMAAAAAATKAPPAADAAPSDAAPSGCAAAGGAARWRRATPPNLRWRFAAPRSPAPPLLSLSESSDGGPRSARERGLRRRSAEPDDRALAPPRLLAPRLPPRRPPPRPRPRPTLLLPAGCEAAGLSMRGRRKAGGRRARPLLVNRSLACGFPRAFTLELLA